MAYRFLLSALLLVFASLPPQVPTSTLALTNVNVIDVASGRVVPAMTVAIAGDRMTVLSATKALEIPPQCSACRCVIGLVPLQPIAIGAHEQAVEFVIQRTWRCR